MQCEHESEAEFISIAMSKQQENILLFGATGYIGTYILAKILKSRADFGRIVVFTSPATFQAKLDHIESLKKQGVEIITGDVTKESQIVKAYEGQN